MATRRMSTIFQHILQPRVPALSNLIFKTCATTTSNTQQERENFPFISAEPRVALHDEPINIMLHNLPSNEKITLQAQCIHGERKTTFASCGHYVSNESGQINVTQQPSTGGTYTGLEPVGILWSLQSAPGQPPHTRMLMKITDRPSVIHLKAHKGHLQLGDIYDPQTELETLADVKIERWLRFPSEVTRTQVHAGNVRGALYLPPGDGPFQGVIDLFGSSGGIIEYRAALLASRGFATLSLPYFRYQDLPGSLSDVSLDYFEEAVNWMSSHPKVLSNGVGVVAVSKGVDYAYSMSAYLDKVKCVVAINGHPYISIDDLYYKGKIIQKGSPFRLDLCSMTEDQEILIGEGMPFTDNLIPAWQGDAKHLILVSEDDYQVIVDNYKLLLDACPEEKKSNFEVVRYPGAGHLLEPPYTAHCRSAVNPAFQMLMLFGGQVKQHAHAQKDSWQRILNHLRKNIPTS